MMTWRAGGLRKILGGVSAARCFAASNSSNRLLNNIRITVILWYCGTAGTDGMIVQISLPDHDRSKRSKHSSQDFCLETDPAPTVLGRE